LIRLNITQPNLHNLNLINKDCDYIQYNDNAMIKKLYLLLLLNIIFLTIYSQEEKRSSISFISGLSIPEGDFRWKKHFDHQGFANMGFSTGIEYTHIFKWKIFGISCLVDHANFGIDETALTEMYNEALDQEEGVETNAGWYSSTVFLVSPLVNIRFSDLNIQLKIEWGYSICSHPSVEAIDSDLGVLRKLNNDIDGTPIIGCGGNVNYWLNNKHGINLEYGVYTASPRFSDRTGHSFSLNVTYHLISLGYLMKL